MAKTLNKKKVEEKDWKKTRVPAPLWVLTCPSLVKELFGFFCLFCFLFVCFLTILKATRHFTSHLGIFAHHVLKCLSDLGIQMDRKSSIFFTFVFSGE